MATGSIHYVRFHMADKNRDRSARLLQDILERTLVKDAASAEIVGTPKIVECIEKAPKDPVVLTGIEPTWHGRQERS